MGVLSLSADSDVRPVATRGRFAAIGWQWPVLALYAIWIVYVGYRHEHWFDEAQAWLLARDSNLWQLLAERIRYEGSPGLWHLILWIAIRCGLSYDLFYLIPAGFAIAGAALLLWRAPFPSWGRILILGSYFFGYQYAVLARSYAVDLLLVPLAALWFADRTARPLRYAVVIGLIANLNAHGFLVAGMLGLELLVRLVRAHQMKRGQAWRALAIAAMLGLFALVTAWQPADNGFLPTERELPGYILMDFVRNAFVDGALPFGAGGSVRFEQLFGFELSILLLLPTVGLIRAAGHGLLAAAIATVLTGFSVITHVSPWHSGLLFLFWIFLLWISWPAVISLRLRRFLLASIAIIGVWQGAQMIRAGLWDMDHVYSPGRQAAHILAEYRATHPDAHIAAYGFKTFAVQPWLPGNPFANYHDAAPHPAFLSWKTSERWKPFGNGREFVAIIESRPDLVVASTSLQKGQSAEMEAYACEAGYGILRLLPGAMMWRGRWMQDDSILILAKGSRTGCPVAGRI
ncbi:hypothetical protein SAMN05518849_13316 [Sphingobium sp. AP50]|uniref:hypothetical protein n=1 Tax=Sphingobium sp. AP50 TaxID=1884369 RepID=UPI0008C5570D|nr:hypothetical protein [Sphingobium sp. AP50]SEK04464.1 hypothetical protein SAMN05518849_13316 [Sphingobium sp. AP50]